MSLLGAVLFFLFLPLFNTLVLANRDTDFRHHIDFAREWTDIGTPSSERFGFELLILIATGFSRRADALAWGAALISTVAMVAKGLVSARLIRCEVGLPRRSYSLSS